MHYEKKFGSYYLMEGKSILTMTDSVAILIDAESGTLLKHGNPPDVHAIKVKLMESMKAMTMHFVVIESEKWDVEELNKCLNISGYAGLLLNKMEIEHEENIIESEIDEEYNQHRQARRRTRND